MVCSPHQYTLQKIAASYMPKAAYVEQQNYLQKPTYQFIPQRELYGARQTDLQEKTAYQPRQQYISPSYQTQTNERRQQRNTDENVQFAASVWTPSTLEQPKADSTPTHASTWQDYGLPLYLAPSIVTKTSQPEPEQKMNRQDLMQRINEELAAMTSTRRIREDYLCAA